MFRLRVAGITLSIPGASSREKEVRPFLVERGSTIQLRIAPSGGVPQGRPGSLLFDSGGLWKVYSQGKDWLYVLEEPIPGATPYGALRIDRNLTRGTLFRGRSKKAALSFPLDEILFQHHLAAHGGLEVHACGLLVGGRAVLFCGDSGAGKTTLARLFERHRPGTKILSDDRIALRPRKRGFTAFGTPWHGSGKFASPLGRPLSVIFFIRHSEESAARRLPTAEAASTLFARVFIPRWDHAVVLKALRTCEGVAKSVPCFDLSVRPGGGVLEVIEDALS